jgi:selenocysteine insertion sequence-binding protein 2
MCRYCDNCVTLALNSAVKLLLKDIVKFQDRLYHRDPVKAFAKRRYVLGFREVMKCLRLKKLKLILIAPDLEVAKQKGMVRILFFLSEEDLNNAVQSS